MSEKILPALLETALAQVHPDRRRFLGMMLTGAAALPLLTTGVLTAQEKPSEQTIKAPKNQTIKAPGNQTIKAPNQQTIKTPNAQKNGAIKFWDQGTPSAKPATGKMGQVKAATRPANTAIKDGKPTPPSAKNQQ